MRWWLPRVARLEAESQPHVLVTVVSVRGSAPARSGSCMLVQPHQTEGTIGGGKLEFDAVQQARDALASGTTTLFTRKMILGPDVDQCCGGEVELVYDVFTASPLTIALFGAGHVGSSLIRIMSGLNYPVRWFDSRKELLHAPAAHVEPVVMTSPELAVESCPVDTYYLIMTHSHALDYELVSAILARRDARFCGLIASRSKAARFRSKLRRQQFSDAEIAALTAPVGDLLSTGDSPMAIAVSVVAQLQQLVAAGESGMTQVDAAIRLQQTE